MQDRAVALLGQMQRLDKDSEGKEKAAAQVKKKKRGEQAKRDAEKQAQENKKNALLQAHVDEEEATNSMFEGDHVEDTSGAHPSLITHHSSQITHHPSSTIIHHPTSPHLNS